MRENMQKTHKKLATNHSVAIDRSTEYSPLHHTHNR